jgi:hypothetical protein
MLKTSARKRKQGSELCAGIHKITLGITFLSA